MAFWYYLIMQNSVINVQISIILMMKADFFGEILILE